MKIKNFRSIVAIFIAVFTSLNTLAYDFEVEGIKYSTISDSTVSVIKKSNKYSGSVVIPSTVTYNSKSYIVTTIGEAAFLDCVGLSEITIPKTVTTIEEFAFMGCTNMKILNYNADSCQYGKYGYYNPIKCFDDCDLETVNIGDSVRVIPDDFIWGKEKVTEIIIPKSVTTIGKFAFADCSGLVNIVMSNNVTTIGDYVFRGCKNISNITIGNGITEIGEGTFEDCTGLTTPNTYW